MTTLSRLSVIFALAASMNSAAPAEEPHPKPTKFVLAGDSTVTDKAGWGLGFSELLTGGATCVNLSAGGRSSKSFRDEGRWKRVLAEQPQFVLIQFGHNDQPGKGPARETDPTTTYRDNLRRYIDEARAAGAKPIVVTSLSRRIWAKDKEHIQSILTGYVDAARTVAREKKAPLVELHRASIQIYELLGPDGCERFSPRTNDGRLDGSHLNRLGGQMFGAVVAQQLRAIAPELKPMIQETPLPETAEQWQAWMRKRSPKR